MSRSRYIQPADHTDWVIIGRTSYGVQELNEGAFAVLAQTGVETVRCAILDTRPEAVRLAYSLSQP